MNDDKNNAVITLLANDALEGAGENTALASILLIDAAACIIVTRLDKSGAREMAGHMAGYIIEQIMTATEALRP